MWQPEQPSSQTVARVGLVMAAPHPRRTSCRYGRNGRRSLLPSAMERPFSNSAPVGQTWTHLPQLVQVVDSPHGVPMSVTTRTSMPDRITPQVWAPSISPQTRTQRTHMMQRLWSMANSGWLASMPTEGLMTGSSKWSTRRSSARSWSSQWLLATQTAQTWLRSRNIISVIVRRYSVSCSDVVVTSMPSATAVVQAGASLADPAISTTHSRHAPLSDKPSRWHIVGMVMPFSVATARIDCPSLPATSAPSMRSVWTLMRSPPACSISQTPAGQTRSLMWARYSSRK